MRVAEGLEVHHGVEGQLRDLVARLRRGAALEAVLQQAVADVEELAELHSIAHGLVVEHGQAVDHADHARARRNRQLDRLLQLREDVRHVLDDGHDVVLEARAVREVRDDALGERDAHLRE